MPAILTQWYRQKISMKALNASAENTRVQKVIGSQIRKKALHSFTTVQGLYFNYVLSAII